MAGAGRGCTGRPLPRKAARMLSFGPQHPPSPAQDKRGPVWLSSLPCHFTQLPSSLFIVKEDSLKLLFRLSSRTWVMAALQIQTGNVRRRSAANTQPWRPAKQQAELCQDPLLLQCSSVSSSSATQQPSPQDHYSSLWPQRKAGPGEAILYPRLRTSVL